VRLKLIVRRWAICDAPGTRSRWKTCASSSESGKKCCETFSCPSWGRSDQRASRSTPCTHLYSPQKSIRVTRKVLRRRTFFFAAFLRAHIPKRLTSSTAARTRFWRVCQPRRAAGRARAWPWGGLCTRGGSEERDKNSPLQFVDGGIVSGRCLRSARLRGRRRRRARPA